MCRKTFRFDIVEERHSIIAHLFNELVPQIESILDLWHLKRQNKGIKRILILLNAIDNFKFGELRKSEFLCVKEKRMKLLVIDIQKGITDSRLFNFDEFIDNTSRIIQAARDNQIEVIYFQHDDGPGTGFSIGDEEFEIAEQVHPREGEKIFTKNINSCFGNKDFTDYVKDENTLMIVGLQTNFCIDATVKSAFERGYKVIVPQGANSTFDNDYMSGEETYKYYNDMMWPKRFATCVSVDEAIKLMQS